MSPLFLLEFPRRQRKQMAMKWKMMIALWTLGVTSLLSPFLFGTSHAFAFAPRKNHHGIIRSPTCYSAPTSFLETLKDDPYSIATLLMGSLLERRASELDSSLDATIRRLNPVNKAKDQREKQRIEEYIKLLSDMPNNRYDPTKSLLGPLYCTLYAFNPSNPNQGPPLWEKISLQPGNLKGQQYFLNRDYALSVVNYAEIYGHAFAIRAQATFSPVSKEDTKKSPSQNKIPLLVDSVVSKKDGSTRHQSPKTTLRTCPDIYNFRTYAAEFKIGDSVWPIPIEGTAQFSVLYADPRLRILLSPTGSESIVGPWEQSGLVVVQVRSDFVTADSVPVDLR